MNTKLFSEAMSEVNDKYYEEAANYHCKKHGWVKFTSLAACAAIVLAVSFATLWKLPSQTTPQPEYEPPIITNPDNQSDNPEQGISLNLNEIKELNATSGSIALMADDYTAMSYEELLRYFDVSLPITETLPYLTLQSNDFGIYQTDNRGIYYDGNFIEFRNSGGTQDINIVLSKVFKHTSDVFDLSADELQFTEINGRELAVFHYTNENGTDCYYAEFLQNDVAFVVSSENISMDTVSAAAGIAGRGHLFDIIEAAVSKQPGNALAVADNLYSMSKDMTKLCSELTDQFRNLMLLKVCPEKTDLIVCMPDELDRLKNISAKLELSEILAKLTVLQECSERMGKALNKRIEFEMCLIKLCSVQIQQKTIDNTEIYDKIKQVDNVSVPEKTERPAETEETASPKPAVNMSQLKASDFKPLAEWSEILAEFTKVSPSVSGTLAGSRAFVYSNIMLIDTKNQFFLKLFKVKENFALLTETIRRVMGKSYVIKARCSAAAESEQKAGKLIEKAVSSGIETVVE